MDDLELRQALQRYVDARARVFEVQVQRHALYGTIGLMMAEIARVQALLDAQSGQSGAADLPTLD